MNLTLPRLSRPLRHTWALIVVLSLSGLGVAQAAESALITALGGSVQLLGSPAQPARAFIKLRPGQQLELGSAARLELVYFDGGRHETWAGVGRLNVGATQSQLLAGQAQVQAKTLPALLVRTLAKTPAQDEVGRTGMLRVRKIAIENPHAAAEQTYAELRATAGPNDHTAQAYLLAYYFEKRDLEALRQRLRDWQDEATRDPALAELLALYAPLNQPNAAPVLGPQANPSDQPAAATAPHAAPAASH